MNGDDSRKAAELTADLQMVRDLITRRGAAWLAKWASLAAGVEPGGPKTDPVFLDYALHFPNCPDPRD